MNIPFNVFIIDVTGGLAVAWRAPFISPGRLETEFSFNYPDLILTLAGLFPDQLQSIISMDP